MANGFFPAGAAAGGSTPADNSVTSAKIADGAIVNADINASAAVAYSKLALTGAIVTGDITDGTIAGGDLSTTIAIPSAATATTQAVADNSTKVSTTAYTEIALSKSQRNPSPAMHGFLGWSFDPNTASSSGATHASQQVWMSRIPVPFTIAVTNLYTGVVVAGSSTNYYMALYNSAGSRIALTADLAASVPTKGLLTGAVTSTPITGGDNVFVWIAFLSNGGTSPTLPQLPGAGSATTGVYNANLTAATARTCVALTGQATMPTSFTPSSNILQINELWGAIG